MKITEQEVKKIGKLSKLDIEGEELKSLTQDFQNILDMVQVLDEADVSSIEIEPHTRSRSNIFRDDVIQQPLTIGEIQQFAVNFEANFHVVPKVIDNG